MEKFEIFGINYIGKVLRRISWSDLIETYKIMTGVYNIPREIIACDNSGLKGHEHKLF